MSDKYINEVGLQTIKTWIEGKFALDSDLDTLAEEVQELIMEGGEPNVIETVKVNGTALTPDAQKAVNVEVPHVSMQGYQDIRITPSSSANGFTLTQNTNGMSVVTESGTTQLASTDYVDANGGKIDKIKVNGTEQTITNKEVDITVPTKTSDITNDSNYQNETQVQALIDAELTSVYKPGGTVEFASLPPLVKENVGYIYDVMDGFTTTADFVEGAGKTYPAHTNVGIVDKGAAGYFYDVFSGMVDLTHFWTDLPGQANTLEAMTVAEINAILEPSA